MQIFIGNKRVKSARVTGLLCDSVRDTYRPSPKEVEKSTPADIMIGFSSPDVPDHLYGKMIYHKNRLIQSYLKVGVQNEANAKGLGVLGIVEADFLQPQH